MNAVSAGSTSIYLTWTAVPGATGYNVYRSTSETGPYTAVAWPTTNAYTNTGLTAGMKYYYQIKAYTMVGTTKVSGAYSDVVSSTPIPATPTGVNAVSAGSTSIYLTWTAVPGATGYNVYRSTSETGTYTAVAWPTSNTYTNTGLTTGTMYYYQIKAYTMVGTTKISGAYSVVVSTMPIPIPATPSGVYAISSGYESIHLTWTAAPEVTGYMIYRSTSATGVFSQIATVTESAYTNTELTTGTKYYFKIKAYMTVGKTDISGSFSKVVSSTPIPSIPTEVNAVLVSSTDIYLTWTAVPGATGYNVYRSTSETGTYTAVAWPTKSAYTNTGLVPGTTYYYQIKAYTMVGATKVSGAYSVVVSAMPTPLPAAPSGVNAVSSGFESIHLTWTAAPEVTGYMIYRSTSATGEFSQIATVTESAYTNTGLTTGTKYYYKIKSYTTDGTTDISGAFSNVVSSTPVPSIPTEVNAVSLGSTDIYLTWTAVPGATGYNVYRSTSETGTYTAVAWPTTNVYTNTGLTTGTTYYYQIKAYTMVGATKVSGAYSDVVSSTPIPATPTE
jgi:fibronectin type 3 domain-containing protein